MYILFECRFRHINTGRFQSATIIIYLVTCVYNIDFFCGQRCVLKVFYSGNTVNSQFYAV